MQAFDKVAPLILGGLKRQGEDRGGEGRVNHIVQKYECYNVLEERYGHIDRRASESNSDATLGGSLG
jgi:hypothetical protein|tara:strand:+ start:128 stop:328 length:201 start_codon:yes stop_codon:yes gene_type:complete